METDREDTEQLSFICNKLGKIMYEEEINIQDEEMSMERMPECQCSLVGKLYQNASYNIQAFQAAIKKAWKNEDIVVTPL